MAIAVIGLIRIRLSIDFLLIFISFSLCQDLLQWRDSYGGKKHLVFITFERKWKEKKQVQREVSPKH